MRKGILLLTTLLSLNLIACGTNEKATTQPNSSESVVAESSVVETPEAATSESTEEVIPESLNYEEIIAKMSKLPEVTDTSYSLMAHSMANTLVGSKILQTDHAVDFTETTSEKLTHLNYNIIKNACLNEFPDANLPNYIQGKYSVGYQKDDFENILHSFYQFEGEVHVDDNLFTEDNDGVHIMIADGEPWILIYGFSHKENDDYLLLNAPCYYGSNGGAENVYMYNANILFKKTEESVFGLQIVYADAYTNTITISSAEATSQLPDSSSKSYGAENLIDHNYKTAWVENDPGTGEGQVITLHLDSVQPVQDVLLYNGYLDTKHLYDANGKVTRVKVDFGSGYSTETDLYLFDYYVDDNAEFTECYPNRIDFGYPIMTDTITITIISASEGTKYSDTCISEIELH